MIEKKDIEGQIANCDAFLLWMQNNNPNTSSYHWAMVDDFVRGTKNSLRAIIAEPVADAVELHNLSGDYIRQLWKQKGISEFVIRECSICDFPIRYLVKLGELYIDTSCNCTNYQESPRYVGWDKLANEIKSCQSTENQKKLAKRYGFDLL